MRGSFVAAVALSFWVVGAAPSVVGTAAAQDDGVARLRARVAAAPTDASLRCQLAFALVGSGGLEEARALATEAIAAIPRPLTARTRRTLGACLYNRGRAAEGLGRPRDAVADYVDSLAVRESPAVSARIESLAPGAPADFPAAALVTFDVHEGERAVRLIADQEVVTVRASVVWHFVTAAAEEDWGGTTLVVYAFASTEAGVVLERVDEWSQEDNGGGVTVDAGRVFARATPDEGVAVDVSASGGGACRRMDGFMDFDHTALVLVSFAGGSLRHRALVTRQHDCSDPVRMTARMHGTDVIVSHSSGELDDGTYAIASLLR